MTAQNTRISRTASESKAAMSEKRKTKTKAKPSAKSIAARSELIRRSIIAKNELNKLLTKPKRPQVCA